MLFLLFSLSRTQILHIIIALYVYLFLCAFDSYFSIKAFSLVPQISSFFDSSVRFRRTFCSARFGAPYFLYLLCYKGIV